jgi:HAD superfamily phosphatase (TIGR01668 family)
MLTLVTPHLYLASVLELEVSHLRERNLDGLLLDVDCTLKDHRAGDFRPEVCAWVAAMRAGGVRLCLVSNGRPGRIGPLAGVLGVDYVARAFKPLPVGCHAALRKLALPPERAAFVGDQLFADVLAGRLAGLFTILVRPTSAAEPWFTRIKRPLERRVLRHLRPSSLTPPPQPVQH